MRYANKEYRYDLATDRAIIWPHNSQQIQCLHITDTNQKAHYRRFAIPVSSFYRQFTPNYLDTLSPSKFVSLLSDDVIRRPSTHLYL